jgi:hypothetical protein
MACLYSEDSMIRRTSRQLVVLLPLLYAGCLSDAAAPDDASLKTDSDTIVSDDNDTGTGDDGRIGGPKGLRYFGYVYSGASMEEVADHVNIVHVAADFSGLTDLEQLEQAQQKHLAVGLDLGTVFFPGGTHAGVERAAEQHAGRWAEYADRIEPYREQIAFFYPVDEPYWSCSPPNGSLPPALRRVSQ